MGEHPALPVMQAPKGRLNALPWGPCLPACIAAMLCGPTYGLVLAGGICCCLCIPTQRARAWRDQHKGDGCYAAQAAVPRTQVAVAPCAQAPGPNELSRDLSIVPCLHPCKVCMVLNSSLLVVELHTCSVYCFVLRAEYSHVL